MRRTRWGFVGRVRLLTVLLVGLLAVAGCTSGNDAVGGVSDFQLVTPGGATEFSYAPDERAALGEISGPAVTGDQRIAVADYPDTVVVLNVWGSWCGPCRAEAPFLEAAYASTKSLGVQFIGINVREPRADASDFEKAEEIPYPSIFDRAKRTLLSIRGYPLASVPSTIVLDRQHRVAHIWLHDFKSPDALTAVITQVANEGR